MPNLSSLAPLTTGITALSNLILVSPQSTIGYQPTPGAPNSANLGLQTPPALLFHYEGEQTATLESDITDHYIETNTAVQDQIALRPEIITTHGFIGELNDIAPFGLGTIQALTSKLITIGAYTPALTITALEAYNEAFQLYQVGANAINSAVSSISSITGSGGESVIGTNGLSIQNNQSKQQNYFQQFYGYWRTRTLFTVQTPWAVFQNMAIMHLRAIQDAETNVITDFEISFKLIRVASTTYIGTPTVQDGRAANQASGLVQNGTSSPISGPSLSSQLSANGLVV